jgi:hypothetical protein
VHGTQALLVLVGNDVFCKHFRVPYRNAVKIPQVTVVTQKLLTSEFRYPRLSDKAARTQAREC